MNIKNRNFLTLKNFSEKEILFLIKLAEQLKFDKYNDIEKQRLKNKNIALIFEKDSTRTRCAFEVAAYDQGANVTYIGPIGSHIGTKESVKDTARVLGRLYDAIEYRGFSQSTIQILAEYSKVPVWNGLTNEDHPTQVLADFMTMNEYLKTSFHNISFCYIGNAKNNIAYSLMLGAAIMGMNFHIAAPSIYQPKPESIYECKKISEKTGAKIFISEDIESSIKSVDFIYTDVWVSMGEVDSVWDERIKILKPYQITRKVLELTNNPNVKFMHCLPALHNRSTKLGEMFYQKYGLVGIEVTEEVFESDLSIVFDQAENRLHTIKALMVATLSNNNRD